MAMMMQVSPDDQIKVCENYKKQQINHFSHRHPLELSHVHDDDKAICSGCELEISGSAYICTKPNCTFLLHDFCFDLPRHIRHHSHLKHPLGLLFSPPYADREFTCDACCHSGHGFTYHCGTCKFDLHIECASFPETENRQDHKHPLVLLCDFPDKMEGADYVCYVCDGPIARACWMYSCLACKICVHLQCAGSPSQS